ncbi:putative MFS family arabinose efflux permease [Variovorax paradoxus]|uniref:MFS family arabinose efflux permease n=1 Tax=Variovorax paradoxus TaxID=34073 RepID=A0AAE4BZH0_VARPD|nr:MFS transporter [Variovorax paradoxus]MDR6427967.1 putative MFS family arabinose efflux permease [Variovorax paradoxus]
MTVPLLAGAAFFSAAALRICDAMLPRLASDFSVTPGAAGQVIIWFAVAYGLVQLLFGPLGDRYGKARLVRLALAGCAVASLASALAPDFEMLVWTRVAWGIAAAGVIPLSMAWIGDTVPYDQRQVTLARLLTGTIMGMMAGQLAGGLFAESAVGWRAAFFSLSVGYAAVALLLMTRARQVHASIDAPFSAAPRVPMRQQLLAVLRLPWARIVLLAVLAEGFFLLGPLSYLPTYLHVHHKLPLSTASGLAALNAVGGLAYAFTARHIVARLGEWRMVLAGGWLMGFGFLAWWISAWPLLAGPIALVVGFGTFLYHNTLQTHATQMSPSARGTSVAVFASFLFTGQALGVTAAGYVVDHFGFAPVLLSAAIALPVAGWGFARALRRRAADH